MKKSAGKPTLCAEHGIWNSVPKPPPAGQKPLNFSAIDGKENDRILSSEKMSFAMVGCSGDPLKGKKTKAVAKAIIADDTSFFYHLGDIIYMEQGSDATPDAAEADTPELWNSQFYAPYKKYPRRIVSVPGNHDGKNTPIDNYMDAFCAPPSKWPAPWKGNTTDKRPAMIQPYVYWRFDTPLAYFVGLYSNIVNGGMLDDPTTYRDFKEGPQYQWLVAELKAIAVANRKNSPKKAVLLVVHYPPYSERQTSMSAETRRKAPVPKRRRRLFSAWPYKRLLRKAANGLTQFSRPMLTCSSGSPTPSPTEARCPAWWPDVAGTLRSRCSQTDVTASQESHPKCHSRS